MLGDDWDFYSCTVVVCVCEYLISSPSKVSTEVQRDAMRVKSRVTRHLPKWMTFKLEHIVSGVISKAYPAARRDLWLHTAAGMNIQIIGVESLIFRSEGKECLNAFDCIASRHLTLRYPKVWKKKLADRFQFDIKHIAVFLFFFVPLRSHPGNDMVDIFWGVWFSSLTNWKHLIAGCISALPLAARTTHLSLLMT